MSKNRSPFDLTALDHVARALAEAEDLPEIKAIRDKAEAARKYAQSAALGLQLQNQAAELKLLAERRAGELLGEMKLRGGNRKSNSHDESLKLSDLGIGYDQSARWQREAAVPEPVFKKYIATANKLGQDITSQGLLRLDRVLHRHHCVVDPNTLHSEKGVDLNNGCRDRRQRRLGKAIDRPPVAGADDRRDSIPELLEELTNHQNLLAGILRPHCAAESATFKRSERQMIARLLDEIQVLLACLPKMWHGSDGQE
jgi:hypothetical protein